jgi:hypothetical protein
MNFFKLIVTFAVFAAGLLLSESFMIVGNLAEEVKRDLPAEFSQHDQKNGSISLYWLNGQLNKETLKQHIELLHQNGFSGISPLPLRTNNSGYNTGPEYLSQEYFELYKTILDELAARNMKLMFYDDCNFPTGTAGGRMKTTHPDKLIKYLIRVDKKIEGGETKTVDIPDGNKLSFCKLMSACISKDGETKFESVTNKVKLNQTANGFSAQAELPEGEWRLQLFLCCTNKDASLVDYLDPDAVRKLMDLTYGEYYKRFAKHFGTTMRTTFYDDHAYYHVPNAAEWTNNFNEKFKDKYGFLPDTLYPSLFEDTGERDAANRAALFGVRDQLNAEGYPRVVSQWAAKHKMFCSGHPAGTYHPNPLQLMGDGLFYFKYQDIPLCDYIHFFRHGVDGFNVPASAAYNYDKDILYCEIYGNFQPDSHNDGDMLYRAAIDVYARGINKLIPHGTWYDAERARIVPEISWRNPKMAAQLKDYNKWVSRCEMILQQSRHVAQVGILYPIADLQSHYYFGEYKITHGREQIRGNRYYDLIGMMTKKLRIDYTLIHPEVLDARCVVKNGGVLRMDNPKNYEEYNLLIIPYCRTIHVSNLKKIKEYVQNGGKILFVGHYPEKSAEFSKDAEVKNIVDELKKNSSNVGFIANLDEKQINEFIRKHVDLVVSVDQVKIEKEKTPEPKRPTPFHDINYAFNVIHKVKDGMNFFFFGNPTLYELSAEISFRADYVKGKSVELWNPHTGKIEKLNPTQTKDNRLQITLPLEPTQSRFIVFVGSDFTCAAANDWTSLFDRMEGWIAGDGIYSFGLGDADWRDKSKDKKIKTAFTFGDSLIGGVNFDGSYKSGLAMVNHCFAVLDSNSDSASVDVVQSDKSKLTFIYNTDAKGKPTNLFDRNYWLGDSIAINSVLYTTGVVVDIKTWTTNGIWLITTPIRDGQLIFSEYKSERVELIHRAGGYEVLFGIAICDLGGQIYVYGVRNKTGDVFYRRQLVVARVERGTYGDIGTWNFWTGTKWSNKIADCNTDAAAIADGISNELSVTKMIGGKYDGKFILIYTEGCVGEKLNFAVSDSPFGRFGAATTFYNCPEPKLFDKEIKEKYGSKASVITYNAKAHPKLSRRGELIVSYNLNTWGLKEGTIFAEKKYGFPRFVRLKF